jgi:membrane protease subunit (stomatin/prohibitin family)
MACLPPNFGKASSAQNQFAKSLQTLEVDRGKKMKCPRCKTENPECMKFCVECGVNGCVEKAEKRTG